MLFERIALYFVVITTFITLCFLFLIPNEPPRYTSVTYKIYSLKIIHLNRFPLDLYYYSKPQFV